MGPTNELLTIEVLYVNMTEVLPFYGWHLFIIGRHRLGRNVIHPGWVSDKSKFMKLKALGYVHLL